jgi:hypothetical protein
VGAEGVVEGVVEGEVVAEGEGGFGEGAAAAAAEERALTAAALNDIFYLMDAKAEAVNSLEDAFNGEDATKVGSSNKQNLR